MLTTDTPASPKPTRKLAPVPALEVTIDSPQDGLEMFRKLETAVLATVRTAEGTLVEDAVVELKIAGQLVSTASTAPYILPFHTGFGDLTLVVTAELPGLKASASITVKAVR